MSTASERQISGARFSIPLCEPEIRGNEWKYIKECLDTNYVSSVGSFVTRFEESIAVFVGANYAVATINGTAALHIALLVVGVEPEDEVLVSSLSFIAPANAVRYVGAWPIFVDAEPDYWQIDTHKLRRFLLENCETTKDEVRNRTTGRRVRAILPVHILGHPVDLDEVYGLAREFKLVVVEDATESLGAKYKGKLIGGRGDIVCFSFNGNKLITTGGGGMIVTSDQQWAKKAAYLTTQAKDDPVEFIHKTLGYNYRLTNIQAAMGCAQLERIEEYVQTKQRISARYTDPLGQIKGISLMKCADHAESVFWMYTILVDQESFGMSSRDLRRKLETLGIQTRPLWQPLHCSPVHAGRSFIDCGTSERLFMCALSLPSSIGLSESDQHYVIDQIARIGRTQI